MSTVYPTELLYQIRVLLRYVSVKPTETLSKLTISDAALPAATMTAGAIISSLDDIEAKLSTTPPTQPNSQELTILQLTRDALSKIVAPATGLSVAYTSMVTENSWRYSRTNWDMSARAYPHLKGRAFLHRLTRNALILLTVALTAAAVWLSTQVAIGKYLLQNIDALHVRQATLATAERQQETLVDKAANGPLNIADVIDAKNRTVALAALPLCNRWLAYTEYAKANGIAVGSVLASARVDGEAASDLQPDRLAGRTLHLWRGRRAASRFRRRPPRRQPMADRLDAAGRRRLRGPEPAVQPVPQLAAGGDLALFQPLQHRKHRAARRAEGAGARQLCAAGMLWRPRLADLRTARFLGQGDGTAMLEPRDSWLSWIRLVLGFVVGACIGLFFTSYAPTQISQPTPTDTGSALLSSLSLSASGLAFLAGFGVEGVFNMLQELSPRVFPTRATG